MKYKLLIAKQFEKDLRKIPKNYARLVLKKLRILESTPLVGRKVRNAKIGMYRIRVGVYRIRYDIKGRNIEILRILHRKEAYRK